MENVASILSLSLIYFFIAFVVSFLVAPPVINLLYKLRLTVRHVINQDKKNAEFVSIHGWKTGTPNMGGLLVILIVPAMIFFFTSRSLVTSVLLGGFVLLGIYGFLDNLLVDISKFNNSLRELQDAFIFRIAKLVLMIMISAGLGYVLYSQLAGFDILVLDRFELSLGWFAIPFFAVLMSLSVYGFDIFDGADGLFSGTFIFNFVGMVVILVVQNQLEFVPVIMIILAVLSVFLYFNIPPARVWMGAVGAMPIGFALFYIAYITGNLVPFFVMTIVQWAVLSSSIIQILSIRLFNKKVFKIAPLHHHFEAVGWPEYKVVMRFWLFSITLTFAAVFLGIYLV